jgi:predicted AAA+ superfamily ATPase
MLDLISLNRWWQTGKVDEIYLRSHKRPVFRRILDFLSDRQVLLIYGLRRTGKTTLLYQLIEHLLNNKTDSKDILFYTFDVELSKPEDILSEFKNSVIGDDIFKKKRIYVLFDEIQKLKNWQTKIKLLYDLYPNIKFIITGSSSLIISQKAKETLAGRIYEFEMPLLNFSEYLKLKGIINDKIQWDLDKEHLKKIYLKRETVESHLSQFVKKGGFIEIAQEESEIKIKEYSASISDKVIFGDIPQIYKVRNPEIIKLIFNLIASNPGFILDYSKVADIFKRDQRSVSDYVTYLKNSMMLKVLYNYSSNEFKSERKLKKAYLTSTNFIFGIFPEKFLVPETYGKIIENCVVVNSSYGFFYREKNYEVDIISKDKIPVEVKYRNLILRDDKNPSLYFCKKFNIDKTIIITKNRFDFEYCDGITVYYLPVWLYLLME